VLAQNPKPESRNQHRPRQRVKEVFMDLESQWTVYRTRFLVRARQLTEPLVFTDSLGREQSGRPGDYLVESSEGMRRITTQAIFEDIYVALAQNNGASGVLARPSRAKHGTLTDDDPTSPSRPITATQEQESGTQKKRRRHDCPRPVPTTLFSASSASRQ